MAEIAAGERRVAIATAAARRAAGRRRRPASRRPPFQPPQLATLVDAVPSGPDWLFEYKYDGYRLLLATGGGAATAWTRNGKDWSDKFRALVKAASALPAGCLIDGEAVALGENGKPDFGLLQATLKGGDADLAFYAFDLLVDQGEDITALPNIERKQRLAALLKAVPGADHLRRPCHRQGRGACSTRSARKAARGSSPRRPRRPIAARGPRTGSRSNASSARNSSSSAGRRATRGAASARSTSRVRDGGKLTYAGKVGTGFNAALIESLSETMAPLAVDKPPLDVPRAALRGSHWIEPKLVGEVAFTEFTSDGVLRHPSFIALREDKKAEPGGARSAAEAAAAQKQGRARRPPPASGSGSAIPTA